MEYPRVAALDNRNDSTFFLHHDQSRDQFRLETLAERPYWPNRVKLVSKILIADSIAVRHMVQWVLSWDDVSTFATDYYAHDLYLDKTAILSWRSRAYASPAPYR